MVKIGLEIHQQLDTHKLFCACPSELTDSHGEEFTRTLRVTASETGAVDVAALEEAEKNLVFHYQTCSSSCLVEADEESPHEPNQEAVQTALEIVKLMGAVPFPETYFMRKIVIDGSNPSGFQRTALLAVGGELVIPGLDKGEEELRVGIESICLEEDAARKIDQLPRAGKKGESVVSFRLDRLGIPLVEITTAPDIHDARTAVRVAKAIGSYLRATGKVKRGLGTIRQDVNVSIPGGTRVEVKGVQDLHRMDDVIEGEIARQGRLIRAAKILRERGISGSGIQAKDVADLTDVFRNSRSKIIAAVLRKRGCVLGLKLEGFAGLLGPLEKGQSSCLSPEFEDQLRMEGASGLFHSDELPAFGVTEEEVQAVRELLKLGPQDAFVLVAEERETGQRAFEALVERARLAPAGVPPEVRGALADGGTRYLRPISSAARMYPETDILPLEIPAELFDAIVLPELPDEKARRYIKELDISREQAKQLVGTEVDSLFDQLVADFPSQSRFVARLLLGALPALEAEGMDRELVSMEMLRDITALYQDARISRDGVFAILKYCVGKKAMVSEAFQDLGLESPGEEQVRQVVKKVLRERSAFVKQKRRKALGPLMGVVMKELGGKADGKLVSELLSQELNSVLDRQG